MFTQTVSDCVQSHLLSLYLVYVQKPNSEQNLKHIQNVTLQHERTLSTYIEVQQRSLGHIYMYTMYYFTCKSHKFLHTPILSAIQAAQFSAFNVYSKIVITRAFEKD